MFGLDFDLQRSRDQPRKSSDCTRTVLVDNTTIDCWEEEKGKVLDLRSRKMSTKRDYRIFQNLLNGPARFWLGLRFFRPCVLIP